MKIFRVHDRMTGLFLREGEDMQKHPSSLAWYPLRVSPYQGVPLFVASWGSRQKCRILSSNFLWGIDIFYTKSCLVLNIRKSIVCQILCHLKTQRIKDTIVSPFWHNLRQTNGTLGLDFLWDSLISCGYYPQTRGESDNLPLTHCPLYIWSPVCGTVYNSIKMCGTVQIKCGII
jgi:hypothetical protein